MPGPAAGGSWPEGRRQSEGYPVDGMCPRCKAAVETSLHRLWQCPANDSIGDPAILESDYLRAKAVAEDGQHSLLWCRGLVPLGLLGLPPPPEQRLKVLLRCERPGELPGGT